MHHDDPHGRARPVTAAPVVHRQHLAAPSVADFRAAVERSGGDTALWTRLCAQAGVSAAALTLSLDQRDRLARVLKAQPGVLGVMGRSLVVRLIAYRTINNLNGAPR